MGLFLKRITQKKGLLGLQAGSSGSCPAGASGSPKCHANTTVCGATATSGVCQIPSFPFSSAFMSLSACSFVPILELMPPASLFSTPLLCSCFSCASLTHISILLGTHTHTYRKVTNCEGPLFLFFFSLLFLLFSRVVAAGAAPCTRIAEACIAIVAIMVTVQGRQGPGMPACFVYGDSGRHDGMPHH